VALGASLGATLIGAAFILPASQRLPPDVHIFTMSKQPWVVLPAGTPAYHEYYKAAEIWPADSLARREAFLAKLRK